ncbi:hypothetical protein OROMI_019452 [Orobanche minor]
MKYADFFQFCGSFIHHLLEMRILSILIRLDDQYSADSFYKHFNGKHFSSLEPLFPGESSVDQLIEIIKVLRTPTREEIKCMNPNYSEFKFPQIKAHPWHKVFHKRMPPEVVDQVSRLLQYSPTLRFTALEACAHPFFDDLREPNACLPNARPLPPLFNFAAEGKIGWCTFRTTATTHFRPFQAMKLFFSIHLVEIIDFGSLLGP